jgi:hypothetical protein
MDRFLRSLIEVPINASELDLWTQLYCFKPNSPLEDFLMLHKCPAPAVFHGLQLIHDIHYIIITMEYYDLKNVDILPKDTLLQKALGCYAQTPNDLKRPIMNQLIPLKKMPSQTIYDKLTGNYFHYDTRVEIPEVLKRLHQEVIGRPVRKHVRTFADVLALVQRLIARDGWHCARIGYTPTIEIKRPELIPVLGGRVIARCELVERLAKYLVPKSDSPIYHTTDDYVD